MHKRTTPKIFGRAKQLHRNMTEAEAKLWSHLRAHRMGDVHFRNHTCPGGARGTPLEAMSLISALLPKNSLSSWMDSLRSQHLEQKEYDEERTTFLRSRGYRILRFWNNDVMNNIDSVLRVIFEALKDQ